MHYLLTTAYNCVFASNFLFLTSAAGFTRPAWHHIARQKASPDRHWICKPLQSAPLWFSPDPYKFQNTDRLNRAGETVNKHNRAKHDTSPVYITVLPQSAHSSVSFGCQLCSKVYHQGLMNAAGR